MMALLSSDFAPWQEPESQIIAISLSLALAGECINIIVQYLFEGSDGDFRGSKVACCNGLQLPPPKPVVILVGSCEFDLVSCENRLNDLIPFSTFLVKVLGLTRQSETDYDHADPAGCRQEYERQLVFSGRR